MRARAYAAAAWAHWLSTLYKGPRNNRYTREMRNTERELAALHAAAAVRSGLVSQAVINIGFEAKKYIREPWKLEYFTGLFAAVREAGRDMGRREDRWAERLADNAAAYVCAAEGCEVKGRHQSGLRKCAGICPHDMKPHYCSKTCQKKVSVHFLIHCSSVQQGCGRIGLGTRPYASRARSRQG